MQGHPSAGVGVGRGPERGCSGEATRAQICWGMPGARSGPPPPCLPVAEGRSLGGARQAACSLAERACTARNSPQVDSWVLAGSSLIQVECMMSWVQAGTTSAPVTASSATSPSKPASSNLTPPGSSPSSSVASNVLQLVFLIVVLSLQGSVNVFFRAREQTF